ncbi:MAG: hypothetical protein DI606_19235 [Sphingobium sp.]|uniref:hypothetical protein n=1 Tax=Sphingobium sp. TaxID=1912891 RepID=UPI000DAF5FCC|nr:hypothetical protein [Sphingobium sp.]PZU05706.1 MAG: hypothetical protein DI606_19235 [Sphingobium sp.]
MAIKTEPTAQEQKQIEDALDRLERGEPKAKTLAERARRGSLKVNLNSLTLESGVRRHRIVKLYPDLAARAGIQSGERGTTVPLRKQLDDSRREKANAQHQLQQAQSYNFYLMERISKFRIEVKLLNERVAELELEVANGGSSDALYFGSDDVIGVPAKTSKRRRAQDGQLTP